MYHLPDVNHVTSVKMSFILKKLCQKFLLLLLQFPGDFLPFVFLICSPLFLSCFLSSFSLSKAIHRRKIFRNSSRHLLSSQIFYPVKLRCFTLAMNVTRLQFVVLLELRGTDSQVVHRITNHSPVTLIKQPKVQLVILNQIKSPQLKNQRFEHGL